MISSLKVISLPVLLDGTPPQSEKDVNGITNESPRSPSLVLIRIRVVHEGSGSNHTDTGNDSQMEQLSSLTLPREMCPKKGPFLLF